MTGEFQRGAGLAGLALAIFSANIILTKIASARLSLNVGFPVSVTINVLFCALVFGMSSCCVTMRCNGTGTRSRYFSCPVFSPLISDVAWLFLGERLSAIAMAAMVITIYGLYLVGVSPGGLSARRRDGGTASGAVAIAQETTVTAFLAQALKLMLQSGLLLGLGNSLAYAVGNVLRGAAMHRWPEPILGALLGAASGATIHLVSSPVRGVCRRS